MEKIRENIYRIGIPLKGSPLKEINSYLIRGTDRDLLIDTGYRREECITIMKDALKQLGSSSDRLDIFLTHVHSDHTGMVMEIAGPDSRIFMHEKDLAFLKEVLDGTNGVRTRARYVSEGMPEEIALEIQRTTPAKLSSLQTMDDRFKPVKDGQMFTYGDYTLRVIATPGHTPGQSMLWLESEKIMFTGDHILFDITPNITAFEDPKDALGEYLDNLKRMLDFPVELALPGHRSSGNYRERILALLEHHKIRLQETENIVKEHPGLSAYEITGYMKWNIRVPKHQEKASWKDFPIIQRWYAVGECLSHLDYLRYRGKICRELKGDVYVYYTPDHKQGGMPYPWRRNRFIKDISFTY